MAVFFIIVGSTFYISNSDLVWLFFVALTLFFALTALIKKRNQHLGNYIRSPFITGFVFPTVLISFFYFLLACHQTPDRNLEHFVFLFFIHNQFLWLSVGIEILSILKKKPTRISVLSASIISLFPSIMLIYIVILDLLQPGYWGS
jgi:ABC-type tungstate transport system substrate-binding protein